MQVDTNFPQCAPISGEVRSRFNWLKSLIPKHMLKNKI